MASAFPDLEVVPVSIIDEGTLEAFKTAVWALTGLACVLAVVAYVVSRTVGLPLMADDIGAWLEPLGVVSVATETAVAVLAAAALSRRRTPSRGAPDLTAVSGSDA